MLTQSKHAIEEAVIKCHCLRQWFRLFQNHFSWNQKFIFLLFQSNVSVCWNFDYLSSRIHTVHTDNWFSHFNNQKMSFERYLCNVLFLIRLVLFFLCSHAPSFSDGPKQAASSCSTRLCQSPGVQPRTHVGEPDRATQDERCGELCNSEHMNKMTPDEWYRSLLLLFVPARFKGWAHLSSSLWTSRTLQCLVQSWTLLSVFCMMKVCTAWGQPSSRWPQLSSFMITFLTQ